MNITGADGGMVSRSESRDYADVRVKEQFDQLMNSIRTILSKRSYTQRDADELAAKMRELYTLQNNGGFDGTMDNAVTMLLALFKGTGFEPRGNNPNYNVNLSALQSIGERGISYDGKTISMNDILGIIEAKKFEEAHLNLSDATLVFVKYAYGQYENDVKQLAKFVEAATKTINNLSALQSILNHTKARMPDNYVFPPVKWDDIPNEILDKLHALNIIGVTWEKVADPTHPGEMRWKPKTDADFNAIKFHITGLNLSNTYVAWSEEYFKKKLGTVADPQPADIPAILNLRDDLIRQMAILKAGGAPTTDGSPYDTISKLVETIKTHIPVGPVLVPDPDNPQDRTKDIIKGKDWNQEFGGPPFDFDKIKAKYPQIKDQVTNWINSGQGQGKTNDLLDKALNANQRLSDEKSKDLQAKNQQLTQVSDLLAQMMETLNKILSGIAQKMARG